MHWYTAEHEFAGDLVQVWSMTSAGKVIFALQRDAERAKRGGKVCLEFAQCVRCWALQ